MNELSLQAMLSPVVLSVAALLLMMQIAFWRHATTSWIISCLAIGASILAIFPSVEVAPQQVTPILISDNFSLFFSALILVATLITALLAKDYLKNQSGENEEFYLLVMLSALCLLYTSPSPRDQRGSRMPSSA